MVPLGPTPGNESLPRSTAIAGGAATASDTVAEALTELLRNDVRDWTDHGLTRIKERTVRSVFEGRLGDVAVHIKVFRANKLSDRARDALRGEPGEREAKNLARARQLGLPAVEPLAFGTVQDGDGARRSFVVTATVPDARPFAFDLGPDVLTRTGALLRRLHDLGCAAADLHPGNLLVDATGALHLIDLTAFRHAGEQGNRGRAAALARFCQEFDRGALARAARPLLAGYQGDSPMPINFEALLADATRRWRSHALPAFGRRSERNCRHTLVERRRRGQPRWFERLVGATTAERDRAREFLARLPAAEGGEPQPGDTDLEPHKSGRRGEVWLSEDFVVKSRDASHARRLWRASYWLEFARVPAPQPIALRLDRGSGLVVTRRIGNPHLGDELAAGAIGAATAMALAGDLGTSVGRLHAHGLRNRDLKLDNLVRLPDEMRIAMTDLDGIRKKAPKDSRGRGADVGRLLAAFREADEPGGPAAIRAFLRGYVRAHRELLMDAPVRRLLRRATQRAGEWRESHM